MKSATSRLSRAKPGKPAARPLHAAEPARAYGLRHAAAPAAPVKRGAQAAGAKVVPIRGMDKFSAIVNGADSSRYAQVVEAGIPARLVTQFAALVGKTKEEVFERISVSRSTANRLERADKAIGSLETDAFASTYRVVSKAERMLGSAPALREWLDTAVPALNFRTPWDTLANSRGREDVSRLLDAIGAGTYA
jgi:putative toxin-antitoxin system antitoxin component (TIGR02293 family)